MRKFGKIDTTQLAIVAALRKIGCAVRSLAAVGGGLPDLLVSHRGASQELTEPARTVLLECKTPKTRNKLTEDQLRFFRDWPGEVYIVTSPEEAVEIITRKKAG